MFLHYRYQILFFLSYYTIHIPNSVFSKEKSAQYFFKYFFEFLHPGIQNTDSKLTTRQNENKIVK